MADATLSIPKRIDSSHAGRECDRGWLVTIRPALAAAAIMLGLAVSAIAPVVPAGAATSPAGPADVAIVVPLTVPERAEGLISSDMLASYTSEFGLLNRELD